MSGSEGRGIQSIEVGGRLLDVLVHATKPMMLRDLAAQANVATAQAHAYLTSYRRVELVEQDQATGHYILGPATIRLGMARLRNSEPLATACQEVIKLSNALGLMVATTVWGPHAPTAIQVIDGGQSLNINMRPGTTFSVTGSASGRIFGAFEQSEIVKARIALEFDGIDSPGVGGNRVSPSEFQEEMAAIRSRGYAALMHSPVPRLGSVAAPVFKGKSVALVITLIGYLDNLDLTPTSEAIHQLLEKCQSLSQ